MKNLMRFAVAVVALVLAAGCANVINAGKCINASGKDVTGSLSVSAITELEVSQAITVYYTVGPEVSVDYSVPESLAEYLVIKCKDGKLSCGFKNNISVDVSDRKITVNVVAPAIKEFEVSTAAVVNVSGDLSLKKVEADVTTGGTLNLSGDFATGNFDVSTAGVVNLSGSCAFINADVTTAGVLNAVSAKIGTGNLDVSTGGCINISSPTEASYKTDADVSGSINVK